MTDNNRGIEMSNQQIDIPSWLSWAREIQSIAQTGYHYALNDFQRERYTRLKEIAAEIMSYGSNVNFNDLSVLFQSQVGYATPKIDVRGAVFKKGKILLVREQVDNCWTLPGGWADVGESPSQSVEREVKEESGLRVKAYKLVGIYDANRMTSAALAVFHAYKIIFLCEIMGGDLSTGDETSEAEYFHITRIPENLSLLRTNKRHIEDAFVAFNDSLSKPVFD